MCDAHVTSATVWRDACSWLLFVPVQMPDCLTLLDLFKLFFDFATSKFHRVLIGPGALGYVDEETFDRVVPFLWAVLATFVALS